MKEELYLVQHETIDEYGDVTDFYDLFITDDYDKAVDFAKRRIADWPLLSGEQITISKVVETDREIDYEGAELLWVAAK